jgi:hypothetical protein
MAAISKKELEYAIAKAYSEGYQKGYDEGYLDSASDNMPNNVQLYTEYITTSDNETLPRGYRFGEEWVSMQLYMEGGFGSEEEAILYWYKEVTKDDRKY